MRNTKVWLRLLGLVRTVLEGVVFDEDTDAMVVSVRPRKGARQRCGRCGRRAAWYDRGEGRRRWRSLDLGELRCYLEADASRVSTSIHLAFRTRPRRNDWLLLRQPQAQELVQAQYDMAAAARTRHGTV